MARTLSEQVLDVWAPLSHKRTLNGGPEEATEQPSWIDLPDWRRLNAYLLRRAYMRNVARHYLVDDHSRDDHREYGDPLLFVQQVTAAITGREQTISVDLADKHDPNPDTGKTPAGDDADGAEPSTKTTPEPEGASAAYERQEWLRAWADQEQLPTKMLDSERQSVGLGDSVYVLGWSTSKRRARIRVYDPGLYFPVLNDDDPDDYPSTVHMIWEVAPRTANDPGLLRRRTWELGPIGPLTEMVQDPETGFWRRLYALLRGEDGVTTTIPQPGDQVLPDGRIGRRYAWQEPGEPPSTVTCYYTDATWRMDQLRADWRWDNLPLDKATFKVTEDGEIADRLDLRIDFLPVVHVPNTVAGVEHFGSAVIDPIAQVFDDLSSVDTDVAAASGLVGSPIIGLSGAAAPTTTDGSGRSTVTLARSQVWGLGENGRLDALDMSPHLVALRDQGRELREIASVNGRVPQALLGRVKPNEVPSGFALALGFTPFESLLGEARLVRKEKYALLLKFVQRMAIAAGVLPAGPALRAEVNFGAYLPANQAEAIDQTVQMFAGGVISLELALTQLQAAGVEIEDVQAEAERIRNRDYAAAVDLFAATGDYKPVYKLLGLKPPEEDPRKPKPEDIAAAAVAARAGQPDNGGQGSTNGGGQVEKDPGTGQPKLNLRTSK